MVLSAPLCSICTRQNGIRILSNGTVEYLIEDGDPLFSANCPQGYQCVGNSIEGCCERCEKEQACPEGAVGDHALKSNICPDGHTCDPFPTKCSVGEICSNNIKIECTAANRYFVWLNILGFDEKLLDGTLCEEGSAEIRNCPAGSYCPDAKTKIACPAGYFCPMKTAYPEIKCPRCPEGSLNLRRETSNFLVFIGALQIIVACLMLIKRKNTKYLSSFQKAKRSKRLKNTVPMHLENHSIRSNEVKESMQVVLRYDSISVYTGKGDKLKVLVNKVSGLLKSKRLCAIFGESGAGKSTLLAALSGQVPARNQEVSGIININGKEIQASEWMGSSKDLVGYVPQKDIVYNELTVYENLFWSGRFQMDGHESNYDVRQRVDETLMLLGLMTVKNATLRCVSGGEKRRCSIGIALMGEPRLLFLDEPTSGLDSSSSMSIMKLLKKLSISKNMAIFCCLHQPRQSIFTFLDDMVLLGKGGNVMYNGPAGEANSYFTEHLGYKNPDQINPADFLLDISTGAIPCVSFQLLPTRKDDKEAPMSLARFLSEQWVHYVETCNVENDEALAIEIDSASIHWKSATNKHRPKPLIQFWYQFQRNFVIAKRNYSSIATTTVVICLGSIIISYLQGPTVVTKAEDENPISVATFESLRTTEDILDVVKMIFEFSSSAPIFNLNHYALKISILSGTLVALAASKSMSDKKDVVYREIDSGYNISSYFLALSTFSIIEHGSQLILASISTYWIRVPLQSSAPYILSFFMLHWGMVSWGHLLAIIIPRENLIVTAATYILSTGLLTSGIAEPITMQDVYTSDTVALIAGLSSPIRYFVEGYVVSDLRCGPEQLGFTSSPQSDSSSSVSVTAFHLLYLAMNDSESAIQRSCGGWYYGNLRIFVVGLMLRSFTLLLIQVTYTRRKMKFFIQDYRKGMQILFLLILFLSLLVLSIYLILK